MPGAAGRPGGTATVWGRARGDAGFTLVGAAVTCVALAAVAVGALTIHGAERGRVFEAQTRSALRSAAAAVASYAAVTNDTVSGLDGATGEHPEMTAHGYRLVPNVSVSLVASVSSFCITADHVQLEENMMLVGADAEARRGTCTRADL
jgi:hypothetical protein